MKRREFLKNTSLAVAGGVLAKQQPPAASGASADQLQVALVGAGTQGKLLLSAIASMPDIHLRAICDIWSYAQNYGKRYCSRYGNSDVKVYLDYRELIEKENKLDAVLIATPDFAHAEQATAFLEAGVHVYCESMMAHSIAAAKSMVASMQRTGKLLQIGHQRRSNPRYRHVYENLLLDANLPDRLTSLQTQWAEPESALRGFPRKFPIPDDILQRFGYGSMQEFRNWMWYPKYAGGPFCCFVSHQLDVCHWFVDALPETVMATGSNQFYADRPAWDTVVAAYRFPGLDGPILASCTLSTSSSAGGTRLFERFCGTSASIQVSENPQWISVCREANAEEWDKWIRKRYLIDPKSKLQTDPAGGMTDVQVSGEVERFELPVITEKSSYEPHLENFFDAIRGNAELNCPADVALGAQVAAFKTLEAIQTKQLLHLGENDFG